jgi:hypothetical protein
MATLWGSRAEELNRARRCRRGCARTVRTCVQGCAREEGKFTLGTGIVKPCKRELAQGAVSSNLGSMHGGHLRLDLHTLQLHAHNS